jgi:signal transduction histidine kinase
MGSNGLILSSRCAAAEIDAGNAELGGFAQALAHELRTPVNAIAGFGQALERSLGEQAPEQARHYAQRIRAAGRQLEQYAQALLSLAQAAQGQGEEREVDLSALARSVLGDLRRRDPSRASEIRVQDGLRAWGVPALLAMVLENLLGNAWKFTSPRRVAEIVFSAQRGADQQLVYRVQDNGAGFDIAYAGKLFGDFQRLHSQAEFPGAGMGLAIVHRIVRRHGGRVWAECVERHGAIVSFTLGAAPGLTGPLPNAGFDRLLHLASTSEQSSRFKDEARA